MSKRGLPGYAPTPSGGKYERPTKRRKKAMAFSKPKSAGVKAIVERNATESPLLALPLETRNIIWEEVLGNKLIHLKYSPYLRLWKNGICERDCTENTPDTKVVHMDGSVVWRKPHTTCRKLLKGQYLQAGHNYKDVSDDASDDSSDDSSNDEILQSSTLTMNLSLLRVCRQTYIEAHTIPWSKNIYSFDDFVTFGALVKDRITWQRRVWSSIRLDLRGESSFSGWNEALKLGVSRSVTGIRQLRLSIQLDIFRESYQDAGQGYELWWKDDFYLIEGLKRLAVIPLTEVEVDIRQPHHQFDAMPGLWTAHDRRKLATRFRKYLLDPRAPENMLKTLWMK